MLLLASNSPRRKQLLALGGWEFSVLAAEIDERPEPGEDPRDYVQRLAAGKAQAVAARAPFDTVVVAADTTVVDGSGLPAAEGVPEEQFAEILGKPSDAAEATGMLRRLRGRTHQVYTALAVLRVADGLLLTDLCATSVTMRSYTDTEIDAYVASGDPLDKAGAYAIQHTGFDPVAKLQGCYTNVVGLPLCRLMYLLRKMNLAPEVAPPFACLYQPQEKCSIAQLHL